MAEFDNNNPDPNMDQNNSQNNYQNSNQNNQNMNWNGNGINNQGQYNKVPEYSFWAEQVQGNPYSNMNGQLGNPYPNMNGQQGNPYPNMNGQQGNPYYNNQGANNWGNGQMPNNNYYYGNPYNNTMNNPYGNNMNNPYGPKIKVKKQKVHKNTRGGRILKFIGMAACFGLVAGASFFGFQKVYYLISPGSSIVKAIEEEKTFEIGSTQSGTVRYEDASSISKVADNALPSIVSINIEGQSSDWFGQTFPVQGSGSGIIVGKTEKELLIATNNHVVEGTSSISITFADGSTADAIIKGTDVTADLAVVSVDITKLSQTTLDAISIAKLGNSDSVKVGEVAIAIGNALGYGQSVTVGYISAKDREVDVTDQYNNSIKMTLLQTDAAINPGNSGGALLNAKGEVIGINNIKYADNTVEGMGFAIPISKATPIITELMNREILSAEEQGFLGIAGNDVTEDVASYYNMPVGVFVNEVSKGGAAEKAGLLSGDIITKVDDTEVTAITQLRDYVNSHRAGTDVQITYMRDTGGKYEQSTVTVTLGQNPNLSVPTP